MSAPVPNTTETLSGSMKFLTVATDEKGAVVLVPNVVEYSTSFSPASDLTQATARIGNDQAKIVEAINSFLRSETLAAERAKVSAPPNALSKKKVLEFAKPYRNVGKFVKILSRAEQTAAIAAMLVSNPMTLEFIRYDGAEGDDTPDE